MQNSQTESHTPIFKKPDENILVVATNNLFQNNQIWQGIDPDVVTYQQRITQHGSFMPRSLAETNESYKQIIPYLLFLFENKLFVMQRKSSASEQRLASKFSLGIGGHIRFEDIDNNNIIDWADREFEEEVTYTGSKTISTIGILNDDSNDVGKVHLGLVLLVRADSDKITINDEHKSGILLTLQECLQLRPSMETWSQICLDFLIEQKIV